MRHTCSMIWWKTKWHIKDLKRGVKNMCLSRRKITLLEWVRYMTSSSMMTSNYWVKLDKKLCRYKIVMR
jgi:hypothetical protein